MHSLSFDVSKNIYFILETKADQSTTSLHERCLLDNSLQLLTFHLVGSYSSVLLNITSSDRPFTAADITWWQRTCLIRISQVSDSSVPQKQKERSLSRAHSLANTPSHHTQILIFSPSVCILSLGT